VSGLRSRVFHSALPACWVAGLLAGFAALERYQALPGAVGATPPTFSQAAPTGRSRLWMFVHPHCPCTRTSLSELARVSTNIPSKTDVEVVLVKPEGVAPHWEQSSLARVAATLPGVTVTVDADGQRARKLGARTSGHVVVYDGDNRLVFSGGITRGRGHAGDNVGSRSIAEFLGGRPVSTSVCAVYGCPLFASPGGDRCSTRDTQNGWAVGSGQWTATPTRGTPAHE
jgi:hypothetical protein